jgi:hypothetical protein
MHLPELGEVEVHGVESSPLLRRHATR